MKKAAFTVGGLLICVILFIVATRSDAVDPLKKGKLATQAHVNEISEAWENGESDGSILYSDNNIDEIVDEMEPEDIYETGENVIIQSSDVDLYEDFYEKAGSIDSHEAAVKYAEERAALYAAAIENGFTVTDSEVSDYVDGIKESILDSMSTEDYKNIISGFESEDAYWEFERNLYKYDLPITKYAKYLEENYRKEVSVNDDIAFQEMWQKEYQNIKDDLVRKQNYK